MSGLINPLCQRRDSADAATTTPVHTPSDSNSTPSREPSVFVAFTSLGDDDGRSDFASFENGHSHLAPLLSDNDSGCEYDSTVSEDEDDALLGRRAFVKRTRFSIRVQEAARYCGSQLKNSASATSSATSYSESGIPNAATTASTGITLRSVTIDGVVLKPTVAFDTFWRFAHERKEIDDRRRTGLLAPWTTDPILRDYHFCNTFRVLDKLSQYLITEVIQKGPQDPTEITFRVLLFNTFTKISTWEHLQAHLGTPHLTWSAYTHKAYTHLLGALKDDGLTLYTGAFIKPAPDLGFADNFRNHLCLVETLMENGLPARMGNAPTVADLYEYLMGFPGMGEFTTYQLLLNLSYTPLLNFHANDFVVAGLGAVSGLGKLFGNSFKSALSEDKDFSAKVIRWMVETQDKHFARLGLEFKGLRHAYVPLPKCTGSKKSKTTSSSKGTTGGKEVVEWLAMDVADMEHTICEVDKYCRVKHPQLKAKKTNMKQRYKPPAPAPRSSRLRSSSSSSSTSPSSSYSCPSSRKEGSHKPPSHYTTRILPLHPALPRAWADPARKVPRPRAQPPRARERRYEVERVLAHRWVEVKLGEDGRWLVWKEGTKRTKSSIPTSMGNEHSWSDSASTGGAPKISNSSHPRTRSLSHSHSNRPKHPAPPPTRKERLFLVHWHRYPAKDRTWEYETSLRDDAPRAVEEYLAAVGGGREKDGREGALEGFRGAGEAVKGVGMDRSVLGGEVDRREGASGKRRFGEEEAERVKARKRKRW